MPVLPVRYYTDSNIRDGGYVWVFKVVGAGAEAYNRNYDYGYNTIWGTGSNAVNMRYFAGNGVCHYRSDCARHARQFSRHHDVRTILLCLPLPIKFGRADYHLTVVRVREHRRAVTIYWMLGAGFSLEVAECIAEFLVGRKLTSLSYHAWLRFN